MHKNRSRNRSPGACLLLVAGPACAHGGLSSLGALHAALMMAVGLGGVVLAAFLIAAVRTGIRNDRAGNWAKAGLFLGASYVFVSLSFYLTSPEYEYSKFPGVVGAIVLALLCVFFLRHRKRARALVLATIGIVTAVLVLVPAQFWKGNAFDLVETIFVDNSAGLVVLPWSGDRDSVRQLLLTEDGREILQFGRIADSDDVGELFDQLPGDRVLLERIDTGRAGEWYDVRHYVADPRYEATRSMPWNKPRHSLFEREVNMYRPAGQRSIGVLLDSDADIDFEAILLTVLSRGGNRTLKRALVDAGRINVRAQSFVDRAFEHRYGEAYRFLLMQGLNVNATNSDGESVLHRAADIADVGLMKTLVSHGADVSATNALGQTPFELLLAEHGERPIVMRPFRAAFPEVKYGSD